MTQIANPSERWTTLVNSAVLGTDRTGPPTNPGDWPWIVSETNSLDPAEAFLDEAASLSVYELAGRSTPRTEVLEVRTFQSDQRVCSAQAGRHLHAILYGGQEGALAEWCDAAVRAARVAPPELIPKLLSRAQATRDSPDRDLLLTVAGERGAWLASLNHEWQQPVSSGSTIEGLVELWESGERDERLAALQTLRQMAPPEARQMLADTWGAETAADRVRLLNVLEEGLSDDDETWLETCLDDRSKLVRGAAADLLSMLPASAFAQRMAHRVAECVQLTPGSGVVRKKKPTIEFTPPNETNDAFKRDSLEAKASGGLGAKASLLKRLVALTPLSAWASGSLAPGEWLAAAAASDWTDALLQGWTEAAVRQQDLSWSEALLVGVCFERPGQKVGMKDEWRLRQIKPLIASLPREAAERLACDALTDDGRHTPAAYAEAALAACDFLWGGDLSDAATGALRKRLAGSDVVYDHSIRNLLSIAAARLAPDRADRVAREWTANLDHWSANFAQAVHDAVDTIRFRRDMLAALAETPQDKK